MDRHASNLDMTILATCSKCRQVKQCYDAPELFCDNCTQYENEIYYESREEEKNRINYEKYLEKRSLNDNLSI